MTETTFTDAAAPALPALRRTRLVALLALAAAGGTLAASGLGGGTGATPSAPTAEFGPASAGAVNAAVPALGAGVRASVGVRGLELRSGSRRVLGLSLSAWGRGTVAATAAPGTLSASGASATIRHAGLDERWTRVPTGLEQTFTVDHAPGGTGPLVFSMRVASLVRPRLAGSVATLGDGLTYSGLRVHDAAGRPVAAHLALRGRMLSIVVADRGARYPLTIDPAVQQEFTAADGAQYSEFGRGLAISGDGTVAAFDSSGSGASGSTDFGHIYLYTRSGSAWSGATEIPPPADQQFIGGAVGMSADGSTLAITGYARSGSTLYVDVYTGGASAWPTETPVTITSPPLIRSPGQLVLSRDGTLLAATEAGGSVSSGHVLVWTGTPSTWPAETPLDLNPPQEGTDGAIALAQDGQTLAVGETSAYGSGRGSVSVYTGSASTWGSETPVTVQPADTHDNDSSGFGSAYGAYVALSPDGRSLASEAIGQGAAGTVYVSTGDPSTWATQAPIELTPPAGGQYQGPVALAGACSILSIGNGAFSGTGTIYSYGGTPSGWPLATPTAFTPSDVASGDLYGSFLALSADSNVLLASAPFRSVGTNSDQGAGYAIGDEAPSCPDTGGGTAPPATTTDTGTTTVPPPPPPPATTTTTPPPGSTTTASTPPPTVAKAPSAATIGVGLGLPSGTACTSRRSISFHLASKLELSGASTAIKSAKVSLGSKVLATTLKPGGKALTISLKGLTKGSVTVKIVAVTKTGVKLTGTATYKTCAKKKKKHGK